ncbi:fungal specific transcription factor domain-containing protein [Aspergillus melleus]|uniref:fungal specific transcription factor domain-containing protein n=1 Tax=Aspergillus melleus TaxID=138277 RepID=UPI001E8D7FE1|nr:uncharacterized protein LDX57_000089 [Aspergillus melleus]KAH8422332.1 hypothetical protein LDX57_000089 [Aspergillus melleus]
MQHSTAGGSDDSSLKNTEPTSFPGTLSDNPALVDDLTDDLSDCGSMRASASGVHYVGGDHWVAILDKIADLKDHFEREEQLRLEGSPDLSHDNWNDGTASPRALLLYGCRHATSRAEILASLPARPMVDRYVSGYFNRLDLVSSSAVHGPTFLQQYAAFWANPSDAPIMWVGLLFSMICLAVQVSRVSDNAGSHVIEQRRRQIELYREKAVQCLLMGEYTKAGPYVLEAIIHYVYIEFCLHPDADRDIWFLLSLEVSLAKRMGYHRDPKHFKGISPFEGEMRRRLWTTVLLGDVLISSQMGMPRMISEWQCDTDEPRNLDDSDWDADMTELPPSRPESELTTSLCLIARRRMIMALGRISDVTAAAKTCNHAEVIRLDGVLHEAADSIPLPLKAKPMIASLTDSPRIIMERLFISQLFYKGQLMLHRRFLFSDSTTSQETNTFESSRDACIDAALELLGLQRIMDEETGPDGRLHTMHWRVTSILNHQFLTATMVLCSLLHRVQTLVREDEIRNSLRHCRTIWMSRSVESEEARMAAEAVNFVLSQRAADCNGNVEPVLEHFISQSHAGGLFDHFTTLSQRGVFQPSGSQDEEFSFISSLTQDEGTFNAWMPAN